MKVLVDATMLDGLPSGAATRLRALADAHAARGTVDVVHAVRPGVDPLPGHETVVLKGTSTPLGRALAGSRLRRLARRVGADAVQLGALPVPRVGDLPAYLTIHDLRFLHDGTGASPARRAWGRRRLLPNLARTRGVVAVSDATADELVAAGVARERVHVVPNAGTPWLDPDAASLDHVAALRVATNLNARYVLHVGPAARHKNVGFLIDALADLRARPGFGDVVLALAGRIGETAAVAVGQRAKRRGLADAVRVLGPIVDEELALLLAGADALAVPSITEGFSIPIVDAQRFGVPVVATAGAALVDTLGGGGWSVPLDAPPEAFAESLASALDHEGDERRRRVEAGREAAARWSWDASAEALEALWTGARA